MRRLFQARYGVLLLAMFFMAGSGCHTSLRRPPAVCQCLENCWGDRVDCVGRSTSISNSTINHRTTQHYRKNRVTRAMGWCSMTGGPHWCF